MYLPQLTLKLLSYLLVAVAPKTENSSASMMVTRKGDYHHAYLIHAARCCGRYPSACPDVAVKQIISSLCSVATEFAELSPTLPTSPTAKTHHMINHLFMLVS